MTFQTFVKQVRLIFVKNDEFDTQMSNLQKLKNKYHTFSRLFENSLRLERYTRVQDFYRDPQQTYR